jgi:hypothetical protein
MLTAIATLSWADPNDNWWDGFGGPGGQGLNDRSRDLVSYEGSLIAGGEFTQAGENENVDYLGRFDGSEWATIGQAPDGRVVCLQVIGGDLYIGGEFTQVGGKQVTNVARYDGSQWHALGDGLDGFVHTLGTWQGDLLAACRSDTGGGVYATNIHKWDGANWQVLGTDLADPGTYGPSISGIVVWNGDLYASGRLVDFSASPQVLVKQWDGVNWVDFGGHFSRGFYDYLRVSFLVPDYEGGMVAGGQFFGVAGVEAHGLAVWDGAEWTGLGFGGNLFDGTIYHGDLVVTGWYGAFPDSSHDISRWDGENWIGFGYGLIERWGAWGQHSGCITVHDGELYVGGDIRRAGVHLSKSIARWTDPATAVPVVADPPFHPLALSPPRPNPAADVVRVVGWFPEAGSWRLDLVAIDGRVVRRSKGAAARPGAREFVIDLGDASRGRVPAGVYVVHLSTAAGSVSRKVTVLQ